MLRWNAQPPRLPRIGAWGHWEWTSTAHIDLGETDRFGNVVGARSFPVELSKKTRAQVTAALGEVAADIVDWARLSGKPLVVEELDFRKKKAALRERSPRYARMRSAFAYRKFSAFVLPGCPGRSGDRRGEPGVHQRPRRGQVCLGLRAVIPLRGGGGDSPLPGLAGLRHRSVFGPDPPFRYLKGIAGSTSGATGGVWPKGGGPKGPVVGVPPREAVVGGNPYPRRHLSGLLPDKARRGMVLPRFRGVIPRRKRSGKLFARPAWYKRPCFKERLW